MKMLALLVVSLTVFAAPEKREGFEWRALSEIAIQERGRLKPLDTFARESLLYVTGRTSWKGVGATETLFSWLFTFEKNWRDEPFIRADYGPLKEALDLEKGEKYFTFDDLTSNAELGKLVRAATQKQQQKEALNNLDKKALEVSNKIGLLRAVNQGRLNILPHPLGTQESWFALSSLTEPGGQPLPYDGNQLTKLSQEISALVTAYLGNNAPEFNKKAKSFANFIRVDLGQSGYPSVSELNREIHYNNLRPFRWAWILFTLAFIFMIVFHVTQKTIPKWIGSLSYIGGTLLITYGITLRCIIAGRPPVTNMYESVLWVCLGTVFFGGVIWAKYKNSVVATSAAAFAIAGLVLGDNLPAILDPSIQPLEPVLRSNFWLTIHVLTITLSYAAFALSLCVGNVVLGNYIFTPNRIDRIQTMSLYMYRAMQIGVVLLASGTILGGVWADYSWGRFWGWDPKEVWALIALLLYLAVLHGRFSGWLKGFGFVATTVVSFLGVLMAWYGVNFVLGVGLHSYGFGSGGLGYVSAYIAAQLGFILWGYVGYRKMVKETGQTPTIFPKGNR